MTGPLAPLFRRLSSAGVTWLEARPAERDRPGPDHWPPAPADPPAPALWSREGEAGIRLGIRVRRPVGAPARVAAHLLAAAAERHVHPVILSHLRDVGDDTGLERFGFRVESVGADDPAVAAALEAEAAAFWGIDLILDAEDLISLR